MSENYHIVVYKSKKVLQLWQNNTLLETFPVGIGKGEQGHKTYEGDMKTPEGIYKICVKNPKSNFYLSLGLNYPNHSDARLGLIEKRITPEQCREICDRNDRQEIPLWDTPLGGQIYIHGGLEDQEWSEGCIRMYNKDIERLFALLQPGVEVSIHP